MSFPDSAAACKSRQSEETSDTPCNPDFLFTRSFACAAFKPSFSQIYNNAPKSRSPVRVPMITPALGVKPMEVSTDLPLLMAVMDEPLPKWQVMIFFSSIFHPSILHAFSATNL